LLLSVATFLESGVEAKSLKKGEVYRSLNGKVIEQLEKAMVLVKGGCYQMGDIFGDEDADERPVHKVCVDDFYMGETEVTQRQWTEIMGSNPSYFKTCDDCPVERVSWDDVQEFIKRLNEKTTPLVPLNKGGFRGLYRLPTEAEWEYAARSGGKMEKWAGTSNESELGDYAWYYCNLGVEGESHPVKEKKPNGLGLYDMSGNVWEWCSDWYNDNYYKNSPRNNPKGPSSGQVRVLRGGSWNFSSKHSRTVNRGRILPDFRKLDLGFRCVMTN
jgi:formylglycine-generating enzyme required for sulfatase activity